MNCPNVVSVFYVKQKYGLNSNASDTGTSIALTYFSICSIVVCLIFGYFSVFGWELRPLPKTEKMTEN